MARIWHKAPYLSAFTAAMILYSLVLTAWAWKLGIAVGVGSAAFPLGQSQTQITVPGYFQKLNWLLYPIFWPVMAGFIYFSWKWYIDAWYSLPKGHVLYRNGSLAETPKPLKPVLVQFRICRRYLVALSLAIGLVLTLIDANCLLHEYGILERKACGAPDFAVAFRLRDNFPAFSADQTTLLVFVIAQYVMQALLIAMAFIVFLQLLLHSVAFLAFERFKIPKRLCLSIRLNAWDDLREFGLAEVNSAINLTYVFIAAAMAIPVLSVLNKPPGRDTGEMLMTVLLPLLLFAPAIIPIFDRIARRRIVAEQVRTAGDAKLTESFHRQRLWPFEQTALSYVGKTCLGIAIACWLYVATGQMKYLLKVVGG